VTGEILLLTGPPGSGKTTTAAMLARRPGMPKVHLHADDFFHAIGHGAIAPWLPAAHAQNGVVMGALAAAAAAYAGGGYLTIVDGIVGPWFVDAFASMQATLHYIVLRPRLDDAIARCRARGGDSLADPDVIAALHRQFADLGPLERHVLPVGGLDREAVLAAVGAALESGRFRLA
jgi:chloramphenicol 3-O-phosphotransferase